MMTNERRAAILEKVAAGSWGDSLDSVLGGGAGKKAQQPGMPKPKANAYPNAEQHAKRDAARAKRRGKRMSPGHPELRAQRKRFANHKLHADSVTKMEEPFKAAVGKKMRGGLLDLIGSSGKAGAGIAGAGATLGATALYNKLKKKPTAFQTLKGAFGPGSAGRKALAIGGIAAAVGAGITGAESATSSISKSLGKKKGFDNMMADNQWLKKEPPKDVKRFYNTLHNFAPKVAKDPLAAGSFMRRSMAFKDEGIQAADIKTLTDINKASKKPSDSLLQNAFRGMTSGAAFGG